MGRAMAPLVFELSTTAFGRFRKVIEAAAAGLLHDFGLEKKDGRKLAAGICNSLAEIATSDGSIRSEMRCLLKRDGEAGTLELACGKGCDLSRTAESAERIVKRSKSVVSVRLGPGDSSLILELRFPRED
jgi:hypothetical protein